MVSKKSKLISAIGIFLIIIVLGGFLLTRVTSKFNFVLLRIYPDIKITKDNVDKILEHDEDIDPGKKYFELTNKADDYGELFKIVWNIKLNRILEIRDYGVMVKADLSDLSEDEMIFIRESTTNPEEGMVFECDESGNEGYTYCSMTGFTYGKSTEEICEILNKVKLVMYMEDENGKITTRKFKASDATIDVKEETDEIEVRETREYYNLD